MLVAGLGSVAPQAMGQTPSAGDDHGRATARHQAQEFIGQHARRVHGASGDTYHLQRTVGGPDGEQHLRYTRTYDGLRVIGGDFVVHEAPDGTVQGVSVAQQQAIHVGTDPQVSGHSAVQSSRTAFTGDKVRHASKPKLIIDARTGAPQLTWATLVTGVASDGQTPSRRLTLVDATTGKVTSSMEQITTLAKIGTTSTKSPPQEASHPAAESGTGNGIYVGQVALDTTATANGFEMTDPAHGGNTTCDMNNTEYGSCDIFTDADNAWGDGTNGDRASAAVDAHYGAALTFDYYKNTYGRDGIFGDGQGVPSRVHYGDGYVNAFWDGQQMTYGDGAGNADPLVELDVAGHEMSHGISEALAHLGYSGDVGGINEANSDIYGTMIEFAADNVNDPPDYDVGEMIDINGDGTPLRYMYNPHKDGMSFNCWSQQVPQSDPHYSSGVGNHFFFLLAEGSGSTEYGTSPTCDGSTVSGIGRQDAAKIWYHALDAYFLSDETYAQARQHTLQSAAELFGQDSQQYESVAAAWTAVSVTG